MFTTSVNTASPRPRKAKVRPTPERAVQDKDGGAEVHWGYTGAGGPENWAKLAPDYTLCSAGTRQSPIEKAAGEAGRTLARELIKSIFRRRR